MSRRRRRLLVPEAREALEQLKFQVAAEKAPVQSGPEVNQGEGSTPAAGVARTMGIPYQPGDNGDLTTRQAGKIGGQLGGTMVQRLIALAEQQLAQEHAGDDPKARPSQ